MKNAGYEFVPIPPSVRRTKAVNGGLRVILDVTLRMDEPVHIGSGYKVLDEARRVVRAAVCSSARPCVPGSTLKGVLRSRYEAMTLSCALFGERDVPVKVRSSSYPKAKARLSRRVVDSDFLTRCPAEGGFCAACSLFGCASLRGRVLVSDFAPVGPVSFEVAKTSESFSPNLHHVGKFRPNPDYSVLEVYELHGRKFAGGQTDDAERRELIQVIPSGSRLSGQVRLIGAFEPELGGVLAALGVVAPRSHLKIGGGKGKGFGQTSVVECCARDYPDGKELDLDRYGAAFKQSADAWLPGRDSLVRIHGGHVSHDE